MNCRECQELIEQYALGGLGSAEEKAMQQHLASGCPACAGALAQAEALAHALPQLLKPLTPPPGAWEKIEARIALKDQLEDSTAAAPDRATLSQPFEKPRMNWAGLTGWAAAAMLVIVMGMGVTQYGQALNAAQEALDRTTAYANRSQQKLQVQIADLQQKVQSLQDDNRRQLVSRDQLKSEMQARINRLMMADQFAVSGKDMGQPEVAGKVFVDKMSGNVTLCALKVRTPAPDKRYELWLIPATGDPMPAGMAKPDDKGMLVMDSQMPADKSIAAVAVTEEPAAGSTKPTLPIQFQGKID